MLGTGRDFGCVNWEAARWRLAALLTQRYYALNLGGCEATIRRHRLPRVAAGCRIGVPKAISLLPVAHRFCVLRARRCQRWCQDHAGRYVRAVCIRLLSEVKIITRVGNVWSMSDAAPVIPLPTDLCHLRCLYHPRVSSTCSAILCIPSETTRHAESVSSHRVMARPSVGNACRCAKGAIFQLLSRTITGTTRASPLS